MTGDGVLVVDKPAGWTSHDVVARTRRLAGTRRVGHAGTLDPMATGVLVLGINRGTKLLTYLVGADKEYEATIRLGASTVTDDAEGEVTARRPADAVTPEAVADGIARLTGPIQQKPSAVSAIKIDGRRSYARVRAGEDVDLPARPVTVHAFDLLGLRPDTDGGEPVLDLDVRVRCSSGTYIRALARDLGADLEVGGHLTALRRTRVGPFGLDRAVTLEVMEKGVEPIGLAEVARETLPVREVTPEEAARLRHGGRIARGGIAPAGEPVAALDGADTLLAIVTDRGPAAVPLLVLAPA